MNWRFFLACVLSFALFLVWAAYFAPEPDKRPAARVERLEPRAPPLEGEAAPEALRVARPERKLRLDLGAHVRLEAEARGGVISRLWLLDYAKTVEDREKDVPYELLTPLEDAGTFALEVDGHPIPARENWVLRDEDGGKRVILENEVDGLRLRKTLEPGAATLWDGAPLGGEDASPYHAVLRIEVENTSGEAVDLSYTLWGPCAVDSDSIQQPGSDVALVFGKWVSRRVVAQVVDAHSIGKSGYWEARERRTAWLGISNNYFTSVLIPGAPGSAGADFIELAFARTYPDRENVRQQAAALGKALETLTGPELAELRGKAYPNLRVALRTTKTKLGAGERLTHEYTLLAGPRLGEMFDRYGPLELAGVNDYGWFGGLVKMFMGLLSFLKTLAFGSWGLAIVLLTFIVKLCLHPVNRRSQASMQRFSKKMQAIKPEMDKLKEEHGNNRAKLNEAMQALWRKHGINPGQQLGGCLMIFLQLPIWFALYNTLRYSLGLRQAEFLYISDLTRPDRLFPFSFPGVGEFSVPFLGEYFNLLPILYVILTLWNQKMQPKPEDPQMRAQFRMMTFMMVFFGFIFYSFPSGFMLYIMTSSALGIIESKIIKAKLAREDAQGGGASPGAPGGDGGAPAPMYPGRKKAPQESKADGRMPGKGKGWRKGASKGRVRSP